MKARAHQELRDIANNYRIFDETEAYLRHRARVHEREKRERLRRKGKLEAYLAEIEKNKPKIESKMENENKEEEEKEEAEGVNFEKILEEYKAVKEFEKENLVLCHQIQLNISPEKDVQDITPRASKKKVKKHKKKKKVVVEEEPSVVLEEAEFKPKMAGRTNLPTFFFSNLVQQNKSVFAKCRVTCRPKKKH
jgi:hypothetical protein